MNFEAETGRLLTTKATSQRDRRIGMKKKKQKPTEDKGLRVLGQGRVEILPDICYTNMCKEAKSSSIKVSIHNFAFQFLYTPHPKLPAATSKYKITQ